MRPTDNNSEKFKALDIIVYNTSIQLFEPSPQTMGASAIDYPSHRWFFIASYFAFGLLHELSHILLTKLFYPALHFDLIQILIRALLGRYCVLDLPSTSTSKEVYVDEGRTSDGGYDLHAEFVIGHSGWIFSLLLAVTLHYVLNKGLMAVTPYVVIAAYITSLEAIVTDLLGFIPKTFEVRTLSNGASYSLVTFWHLTSSSCPNVQARLNPSAGNLLLRQL